MFNKKSRKVLQPPVQLRINPDSFKTVEDLALFLAEMMQFTGMSEQFARFMRDGRLITNADFIKRYGEKIHI